MSPVTARTAATRRVTSAGTATPIVSATASSTTPVRASRAASSTTRSSGTSPSKGQPKVADSTTEAGMPAAVASGTTSSTVRTACSVVMPWLRLAEGVRRHDDQVDLVDRRQRGPGEAAAVEHEADEGHGRPAVAQGDVGAREDRLGVGHLRHPLRIDEGRGLDPGEAGIRAATYELDLVRRRQLGRVVLEAVPRGDLDDRRVAHDATVRLSRSDR